MKLGMNDVRQCVTELRSRFRIFAYVMLIVVIRIIKLEAHKNTAELYQLVVCQVACSMGVVFSFCHLIFYVSCVFFFVS